MRAIAVVALALLMVGCSNKSVVQKWANSEPAMASHSGPVCFLPTELPDGVESTFLGRAVANQQWYGDYTAVNSALADVARSVGADVITEKRQKKKFGFFAWARPQVWGWARRLDDPAAIDCVALGGRIDPGNGVPLTARKLEMAEPEPELTQIDAPEQRVPTGSEYDECMARVMRISDAALRVESMAICDDAARELN
ncbi:hypothetical protein IM687_13760 [Stutzerimonas stutzeri]|uniref:hypothetical protein n=1 Tax=Stutzerimonas stutzeri TaxID=316 RepID=UPI0018A960E4|nr:hypothetical protein [Stutzerimonas stutzeri]QPI08264.1 hypothetical protein IM687_13760 [Stutzerimonas stutzeri]